MSLSNTIQSYIVSKGRTDHAVKPYDDTKAKFFKDVQAATAAGTLNAVWLIDKIQKLSDDDRRKLFYKGWNDEARISSKAAKLVMEILDSHDYFITEEDKAHLITGTLTSRAVLNTYIDRFVSNPSMSRALTDMQRELQSYLLLVPGDLQKENLLKDLFQKAYKEDHFTATLMIEATKAVFHRANQGKVWLDATAAMVEHVKATIERIGDGDYRRSQLQDGLAVLLSDKDIAKAAYNGTSPAEKAELLSYMPAAVKAILPDLEVELAEAPRVYAVEESKDAPAHSLAAVYARQLSLQAKEYVEAEYTINGDSEKALFLKALRDELANGQLLTVDYLNRRIQVGFPSHADGVVAHRYERESVFHKDIGYRTSCKTAKIVFHLYEVALERRLLKHEKHAIVYGGHDDKMPQAAQLQSVEQRRVERQQADIHQQQSVAMHNAILDAAWTRIDALPSVLEEKIDDAAAAQAAQAAQAPEGKEGADAPSPSLIANDRRLPSVREMMQVPKKVALGDIRFDCNGHALMEVMVDDKLQHVSVDVIRAIDFKPGTPLLKVEQYFVRWLEPELAVTDTFEKLPPYLQALFRSKSRGSINNMQLEVEGHIRLCARTYLKKYQQLRERLTPEWHNAEGDGIPVELQLEEKPPVNIDTLMEAAIQSAVASMSKEVVAPKVQEILSSSYSVSKHCLDMPQVESKLDKAFDRSKQSSIHDLCVKHIVAAMRAKQGYERKPEAEGDYIPRKQLLDKAVEAVTDKDFKSTTATDNPYLHTDNHNETSCWIQGTNYSAHDKQLGATHMGLQLMRRAQLVTDERGVSHVESLATSRVEARVPSLAISGAKEAIRITDVRNKLGHIYGQLSHQVRSATHSESVGDEEKVVDVDLEYNSTGPVIYNALTSLHTKFKDNLPKWLGGDRGNYQRRSIDSILMGAHQFNREKVTAVPADYHGLFLLQNIPVNQHTNNLDLDAFDDPTGEASLMVEVAMLATLQQQSHCLPHPQRTEVSSLHELAQELYVSFLKNVPTNNKGKAYFHRSKQGRMLRDKIKAYNKLRTEERYFFDDVVAATPSDSLETLAAKALYRIHAYGLHRKKENGMTVQALSIFLQTKSLFGCKSANERFQAVANRVELLHGLAARETKGFDVLSAEERDFRQALAGFCQGDNTVTELQVSLNKAYNVRTLSGSATVISIHDQAARSKVTKSKWGTDSKVGAYITNKAEPKSVSYLFAASAAKCQTGKGHFAATSKDVLKAQQAREMEGEARGSYRAPTPVLC
ncbi:MAG: hypothetical protein P1U34_00915 [Coxiellaceae bacterium]|nr:hypothetical protein [Coxiellaceae bacterium]